MRDLFRKSHEFNFFQAVWLLERMFPEAGRLGTGDDLRQEPLRIETFNSLGFPAADVAAVLPPLTPAQEREELERTLRNQAVVIPADFAENPAAAVTESGRPLRMRVTFMGLYGVSSPLPAYFVDPITLRRREYFELKKFIDVFTHRLYSLFYRAWKKYRPQTQFETAKPDPFTQRLLALSGQWPDTVSPVGAARGPQADLRRIAFARFFGNRVRSAKCLEQMLEGVFGFPRVRVRQNLSRRVEIPKISRLGARDAALGTARLGRTMADRASWFRVTIGPVSGDIFDSLRRPGWEAQDKAPSSHPSALWRRVRDRIDAFLLDPLDYEVEVILDATSTEAPRIGSTRHRLGAGAWLGNKPRESVVLRF